jgi:hypothetical protein
MSIRLKTYFQEVERLGRETADREIGAIDYLPQLDRGHLNELAGFRAALLTESDRSEHAGLLVSGLFNWLDGDQKLGLIVLVLKSIRRARTSNWSGNVSRIGAINCFSNTNQSCFVESLLPDGRIW